MAKNEEKEKENNSNTGVPASALISGGKDLVKMLRDLLLLVLGILLLIYPEKIKNTLISAGFKEGNIAGFKWEAGMAKYDVTIKESQATINNMKVQLDASNKALAEAQANITDLKLKKKLETVQDENKRIETYSSKTQEIARQTIAANANLVKAAQTAVNQNYSWGVVYGGDTNLKEAKYETDVIAPNLGIPNPVIYFRQNSYRSVSVVKSREEGERVLKIAKKRRSDSYLVPMATWCSKATDKGDFFECLAP